MLKALKLTIAAIVITAAGAQAQDVPPRPVMADQTDSASVAIANVMGPVINKNINSLQNLGVLIDRQVFVNALYAYLMGVDTGFTPESADAYMDKLVYALHPEMAPQVLDAAAQQAYVDEAAKTPGARVLDGGVVFITLKPGEGGFPKPDDNVTVQYVGQFSDGEIFDSTAKDDNKVEGVGGVELGGSVDFHVSGVIPGLTTALQQMQPGGIYRVVIPAAQAYGPKGISGAIPGNAALNFTVRLLGINGPDAN